MSKNQLPRSLKIATLIAILAFSVSAGPPARITPAGQEFMQPVWSPSSEWIAITGPKYKGIWIVRPDGSSLKKITDEMAAGFKMQWSPDSKLLLGRAAKMEKRRRWNAVKAYEISTAKEYQLSEYRTLMPGLPQWAGNSARVALFANRGLEFFEVPGRNDEGMQKVLDHPIVFSGQKGLFVSRTTSKTTPALVQPVDGYVVNAELSPTEDRIAFEMADGNLYVSGIDGAQVIELGRGERPHWSPDGEQIAYMISSDDGHRILSADIFLISKDGGRKTNVTDSKDRIEMNCTWSPDGSRLAYDERQSGAIWIIEIGQ